MPSIFAPTLSRRSWMLCLPVAIWLALLAANPAAEPETPKVVAGIAYKSGDSLTAYEQERCKLDLYLPAGQAFATLVWFHGGGLTGGAKDGKDTVAIAGSLARGGIAVASVNYRLSPKAPYPAYLEDGAAAFAWVKSNIAQHGGDPRQVFIGGHSAGAYLALMIGLDDRYAAAHQLKLSDIAGLVPISGQTLTHYTIRQERGLPKNRIIVDDAAPVHHARKDAPPMLILFADKDMAMRAEENQLLISALKAAGHTGVTGQMIKGRNHGSIAHEMAKPGDPGRELVLSFIRHLAPTSP